MFAPFPSTEQSNLSNWFPETHDPGKLSAVVKKKKNPYYRNIILGSSDMSFAIKYQFSVWKDDALFKLG